MSNREAVKRIKHDLERAEDLKDCGIFVHQDETNLMKVDAIIVGPAETPYQGGFFHFEIKFPSEYPHSSPKVRLLTTGRLLSFLSIS